MKALFRWEANLLLRNRMFIAMVVVLAGLATLAGWQGGALARAQAVAIERAAELEQASDAEALTTAARIKAAEIDPPWWQSPLNVQAWSYAMVRHVSLPPEPLAGIAIADADLKPFLFRINPHPPDRWSNKASELTPSVAAYGGFDLVDLILMLTPLVALIAFADVIRDRDGSDRQHLGIVQSAGEMRLLAARLAPRAALALVAIGAAATAGFVASAPPLSVETVLGAVTILAVFITHGVFWVALGSMLIIALRGAVTTCAVFVSLWFVIGVLSPSMVETVARITSPPPAPLATFSAERAAIVAARMREEQLTRAYAAGDPLASEVLLGALEHGELLITPTNLLIQRDVDRRRAAPRKSEENARSIFERRARRLALGSPTLIARDALHEIAGRGWCRRAAFYTQVDAYYADLQTRFTPLLMRRAVLDDVHLPPHFEFDIPDHENRARSSAAPSC